MTQTLNASEVNASDLDQVANLIDTLPQGSPLAVLLQYVVSNVRNGQDVTVLPDDEDVSPNQAAEVLRMSRPHLLKFLDGGELAFHRVGTHRRIRMHDLLDFIQRREEAKATIAVAYGNHDVVDQALRNNAAELNESDLAELGAL